MSEEKKRKWILAAGFLDFMCLGLMYSWSKFATEIRTEMGFDHAQITYAYSICMAMFTIGILLDGVVSQKWKSRTCVLIGVLLSAIGYLLTSFVTTDISTLLYLTYGPFVGIGIGLVYNEWLHNIMQWFPDMSGRASGFLLLGMGLSGVTTTPLIAELIALVGWRFAFRVIALLILMIGLFTRQFILEPQKTYFENVKTKTANCETVLDIPARLMIQQPCFWTFALWKLILVGLGQACSGQLTEIVKDMNGESNIQLLAVSFFVVCNGAAKLIWGICCDTIGRIQTMKIVAALTMLSTGTLVLFYQSGDLIKILVALFTIALCYGGAATLGANYVVTIFGRKYYKENNAVSALTCLPVNIGATAAMGMIRTISGSYYLFFLFAFPAAVIALLMSFVSNGLVSRIKHEWIKCKGEKI